MGEYALQPCAAHKLALALARAKDGAPGVVVGDGSDGGSGVGCDAYATRTDLAVWELDGAGCYDDDDDDAAAAS